ncbi:MAG TPA: S-methyl-5-thioribose-1-phosphate isomerase [Planctomycetota bacterium]|nr:S-methyl-5-thioribose-1-phosphate isomerase [Planctomycetota bacterium]
MIEPIRPLRFAQGALEILDQTRLPGAEVWLRLTAPAQVIEAIRSLRVRGAPAIGVAGAYALVLAAGGAPGDAAAVRAGAPAIAAARPTAVNLRWAVERMLRRLEGLPPAANVLDALREEADAIRDEDERACRAIGRHGAALLGETANVLTHCNAGSLATAGYGTALGVIYAAVESGKHVAVFADETRPLLQGSRLTAWELRRAGIEVTLLADSAAGALLRSRRIDAVVVGADRIARNGDVANKIGTYPLAVLANAHGVPFYVAAPRSTFDLSCADGSGIPIEERAAAELTRGFGASTAPDGVSVYAPAFDVTPAALVTAIITEVGVIRPVTEHTVTRMVR